MSHITTIKSKIAYKDTNTLVAALEQIAKVKQGFQIIRKSENEIQIRYTPIETYQRNGNLHFVKVNGVWEVKGDSYNCREAFNEIISRVATSYQEVGLKKILLQMQYTAQVKESSAAKVEMVGVKY